MLDIVTIASYVVDLHSIYRSNFKVLSLSVNCKIYFYVNFLCHMAVNICMLYVTIWYAFDILICKNT